MKYISRYGDKDRENTLLLSVSFRFLFVFFFQSYCLLSCRFAGLILFFERTFLFCRYLNLYKTDSF